MSALSRGRIGQSWTSSRQTRSFCFWHVPRALNVPLLRALWYLLDGIWGLLKGSWGGLVRDGLQPERSKLPKDQIWNQTPGCVCRYVCAYGCSYTHISVYNIYIYICISIYVYVMCCGLFPSVVKARAQSVGQSLVDPPLKRQLVRLFREPVSTQDLFLKPSLEPHGMCIYIYICGLVL